MRPPIACIVLALLPAATWAIDDAAFARCRAMADPGQRLSCYDALQPAAGTVARPSGTTAPSPGNVPAARTSAATAAGTTAEQRFGLPAPAAEVADVIESHIPGRFSGWEPGSRLTLGNGQVWQVSDGSRGVFNLVDPKVRVRRGVVGSYYLEIEGQNRSPRVRRVR